MSKIIFYTDLHHGRILRAESTIRLNILGPYAIAMQRALNAYAEKKGITTLLHGGDESSFIKDPKEHNRRAAEIFSVMQEFSGDIIRVRGNHDPEKIKRKLRFTRNGLVPNRSDEDLSIIVCQPDIKNVDGKILYQYRPHTFKPASNQIKSTAKSITALAHFAFDRQQVGYPALHPEDSGYAYIESAQEACRILKEENIAKPGTVISCHGHEHRFRLSKVHGFISLTMPSIVQAEALNPDTPCGLFTEIETKKNGKIHLIFKQISLNEKHPEKSEVQDVSFQHLCEYYYRPYVPPPLTHG